MSESVDHPLLHRFCAGECTPQEQTELLDWAMRDPVNARTLREVQTLWTRLEAQATPSTDALAAWSRTERRIDQAVTPLLHRSLPTLALPITRRGWSESVSRYRLSLGGAAVALVAVVGVLTLHRLTATAGIREFATGTGQQEVVVLGDGTRLVLAPETRMRVPTSFGISDRTVQLDGEAYCEVVHDARRPFAIQTSRATVTDVGTKFDVRGYADDPDVGVAVVEGQVAIGTPSRSGAVTLSAGEEAAVTAIGVAVTRGADVAALTSWRKDTLVFENTPLPQALRTIARSYGVNVTLADTVLSQRTVTALFKRASPVTDILEAVAHAIGARVLWSDRAHAVLRLQRVSTDLAPFPLTTVQARQTAE